MFHPLTYEGGVDFTKIQDTISRNAIEIQVNEYGQTPKQLFKLPHPKRFSNKISEIFINDETSKIINLTIKPEFENEIGHRGDKTSENGYNQIKVNDKTQDENNKEEARAL